MFNSVSGCLVACQRPFGALIGICVAATLCLAMIGAPGVKAQEAVERHMLDTLGSDMATKPSASFPMTQSDVQSSVDQLQPLPSGEGNSTQVSPSITQLDEPNTVTLLDDKPPLRVGLISEQGASYLQARIEPFRRYLQESLSRPIEIVAYSSMRSLMAAHIGRQVDYSIYPASIFSMAYASCGCLTPMVAPISREAPDGIYMLLVVRGASGIQNLADLSGRSMALSSKDGAIPFYMAMNELKKAGLNPERDLDSLVGKDSPDEALELLDEGAVDAALVWSTTPYNQNIFTSEGAVSAYLQKKHGARQADIKPDFLSIWHSPAIPAGPHVIHNEVDKQTRADLINALKEMNQRDPEAYDAIERRYGGGFRSVSLQDYEPLIEIATAR
nr:PhnD/SsuA/transferrin family substrate-binding protein [uncultured Cohaesibacter sp.]